ncbi:23760_t:CDS:2, partial [Gigaspora margarita]
MTKSNKCITPYTRQKEFPNIFNVLNNTLVCICCGHLVTDQNSQFQTLEDSFSVAESKKAVVKDLVEAFVKANILLEK